MASSEELGKLLNMKSQYEKHADRLRKYELILSNLSESHDYYDRTVEWLSREKIVLNDKFLMLAQQQLNIMMKKNHFPSWNVNM